MQHCHIPGFFQKKAVISKHAKKKNWSGWSGWYLFQQSSVSQVTISCEYAEHSTAELEL